MDFEVVPRRPGEQGSNLPTYFGVGLGIAALAAGSANFNRAGDFTGQNQQSYAGGVISSDASMYSSRLIKKDFSREELESSARNGLKKPTSLPEFPRAILEG